MKTPIFAAYIDVDAFKTPAEDTKAVDAEGAARRKKKNKDCVIS